MRNIALILSPPLVVMLLLAACAGDDDDDGGAATVVDTSPTPLATVQNQPEPVQPSSGEPSQPEEGVYEITAENVAFQGNDVVLPLGQPSIIRVVNRDQLTHNLRIAGLDGQYDTEDDAVTEPAAIEPGSSGELSFAPAIPGKYTFRCDYHPGSMGGQITVEWAGRPLTAQSTLRYIRLGADGSRPQIIWPGSEVQVANQVGKRYQCTTCGTEMIVTKAGDGEIGCCGQPMQQKQ